jgi:O-antigen ligase
MISIFFWSALSTEFTSRSDMSVQLRRFGWTAATEAIRDQPLIGAGFHQAPIESYKKLEQPIKDRIEVLSVDNSYLTLTLEEGLAGLALWMVFLVLAITAGVKTVVKNRYGNRAPAIAAFVSLTGFCLNAVTFEALFIWSNLIFFWVSAGILRGTGQPAEAVLFTNSDDRA